MPRYNAGCLKSSHPSQLMFINLGLIEFNMEQTEDGLRLQIADLQMDNIQLIEKLRRETESRETLACEYADDEEKMRQMQMTIDQYEEASLR